VEHALARRVLARANRSRRTWLHSTKLKVAAALASGFMIGSVGLASAGALPGPAQDVARAALGALGVDVPPGHDRYNGPECGNVTTHGEYVDAHPDDPAAGKSPCGKPNKAVNHPHPQKGTGAGGAPGGAKRHGPPPWAGQGKGKDKGTDKDNEDSPTPDSPSVTPTNPVEPTTTAVTVTEVPTTTTLAAEPADTTSTTSESDTSTTLDSTTSTSTTTEP
jgi:hypothetical protein